MTELEAAYGRALVTLIERRRPISEALAAVAGAEDYFGPALGRSHLGVLTRNDLRDLIGDLLTGEIDAGQARTWARAVAARLESHRSDRRPIMPETDYRYAIEAVIGSLAAERPGPLLPMTPQGTDRMLDLLECLDPDTGPGEPIDIARLDRFVAVLFGRPTEGTIEP